MHLHCGLWCFSSQGRAADMAHTTRMAQPAVDAPCEPSCCLRAQHLSLHPWLLLMHACRLLFEVLHKVLPMHLPDDRLLVSGQAAAASRQTGPSFITGSIKHPTRDEFVPAASAVSAAASATSTKHGSSKGGRSSSGGSRRHRKQGLTVKTLRRMLVVVGPEGVGVRRRAALTAFERSMVMSLGVVLVGGVLGWVSGARAAQARQQQQELRMQQRAQLTRLEQQQEAAAKGGGSAASSRARRHERRVVGRRQSESVSVAAVV